MTVPTRTMLMAIAAIALTIWNGVARADDGGQPAPLPAIVPLHPIKVPIVDHGTLLGQLELRAMWRAADGEAIAKAEQRLPALRSALVGGAADHAGVAATPSHAVDPAALARDMEEAALKSGFSGSLLVLEAKAGSG